MQYVADENAIRALVYTAIESYAAGFERRHLAEVSDPDGTLNMKIHNVFIAVLGPEIQYYTALVRSLDSSLGNMLEALAINIAKLFFDVRKHVEGPISPQQTNGIAELLEAYKRHAKKPSISDYDFLRAPIQENQFTKRHDSDYYLINRQTGEHFLIELKIGGDLDTKKARSEKEAILEQFAILSNSLPPKSPIHAYFATAYNRFGEDQPWTQGRVRQFFAEEELLIGKKFWDFVCQSPVGYETVLDAYKERAPLITSALAQIKTTYLGNGDSRPPDTNTPTAA
ncbi:MAG: TdeIII family type II restriction endonuclease [Candidatus Korobacteraceae bacterium]